MQKMLMLRQQQQQKLLKMRSLLFSWNLTIFWPAKLGGRYPFLVGYLIYLFKKTGTFLCTFYVLLFWIKICWFNRCLLFQIRGVDPTLDMEADEGDDYTHLPVSCITPIFILRLYSWNLLFPCELFINGKLGYKIPLGNNARVCISCLSYTNFLKEMLDRFIEKMEHLNKNYKIRVLFPA